MGRPDRQIHGMAREWFQVAAEFQELERELHLERMGEHLRFDFAREGGHANLGSIEEIGCNLASLLLVFRTHLFLEA